MSGQSKSPNDLLVMIMGAFVVMAVVLFSLSLGASTRPADPVAARRWDATRSRQQVQDAVQRDVDRREMRTTIISNMPAECRDRVAAAIPDGSPPDQDAMLATVHSHCPQAEDDDG